MSTPFETLGVTPDADERTIKRAYAQRLRACRPDEDPEGFQRLRQAYEWALHWQASHQAPAPPTNTPAPHEHADLPAARPEPPAPRVEHRETPSASPAPSLSLEPLADPQALIEPLLDVARAGDPQALDQWLQGRQEWWSLQAKAMMGHALMSRLFSQPAPMPASCTDVLLRFFDLDHVRSGYDPLHLQELRQRMELHWELNAAPSRALAHHTVGSNSDRPDPKLATRIHRQLTRPLSLPQAVWFGLPIERPSQVFGFMHRLSRGQLQRLLAYMPREQLSFWYDAADRSRMNRARFAIGTARTVAALLIAMLVVGGLLAIIPTEPGSADKVHLFGSISGWLTAGASLWFVYAGWLALDQWQHAADAGPVSYFSFRSLFIPLLCLLTLVTKYTVNHSAWLTFAGMLLALVLSIRRYRRRNNSPPVQVKIPIIFWLLGVRLLYALFQASDTVAFPGDEIGVLVAMGFWIADVVKERGRRQVATA